MIAGPYKMISSVIVTFVVDFERKTYVCPMAVAGITAAIIPPCIVGVTDVVSSPLTKTTKKVDGRDPLTLNVNVMPGAAGMPCVAVSVGNALTGNAGLLVGQDFMNAAARV